MFRLTREVRFAINCQPQESPQQHATNNYAGFPSLGGLGHYFALQVTLAGQLDPATQYLQNIKRVDELVRERGVPLFATAIRNGQFGGGGTLLAELFQTCASPWPNVSVDAMTLVLSPFQSLSVTAQEFNMVRLSQKFEFSASHRLFNPGLSDEQNRQIFGKCSNPHGHGHNYELEVTIRGQPDERGVLINIPEFERIVAQTVVEPFDHKNLNVEVAEFRQTIPTVENITAVIYRMLKPRFLDRGVQLASVTVWETPKTWCEYEEG